MMRQIRLLPSALAIAVFLSPAKADLESRQPILGGKIWGDLGFIENRGQLKEGVRFYLREGLRTTWITNEGLAYTLRRKISDTAAPSETNVPLKPGFEETGISTSFVSPSAERRLVAAGNLGVPISLHGRKGALTTSSFERLVYADAWEGIDLVLQRKDGELTNEITLKPGANPERICFRVSGHEGLEISGTGSLVIQTTLSPLELDAPFAYQTKGGERSEVAVHFRTIGESQFGFELGAYDLTQPLVIDLSGRL